MIEFTDSIKPMHPNRHEINQDRASELAKACADNPDQWARVNITWLYPSSEGADAKKLHAKAANVAQWIRRGKLRAFKNHNFEAKKRGTDLYVRVKP